MAASLLRRGRRGLRKGLRAVQPRSRAQLRSARDWARTAVADLPDHTHAAHLVGLVPPPPAGLPPSAGSAVTRTLDASSATCLQRCLVLQAWMAAHGNRREVAVGFRTAQGFEAHAWIPGYHDAAESAGYLEIARVPPPGDPQAHIHSVP